MEDRFNIETWFNNPLFNMALNIAKLSRNVYTIIKSVSKEGHQIDYCILEFAKPNFKSCLGGSCNRPRGFQEV
jgi:hypothetical protein